MISRLLPRPSQFRLLYNLSSKSQSSNFLVRHFSSDQNDNRNSSSNSHSDSNLWKLSTDEKFDSFFNSDSNVDSLSGIADPPGVGQESWLAEEKSGGGGGNEWLNSDSYKMWSLDEAESEKKTGFDIGQIATDNTNSEIVSTANLENEKSDEQSLEEEEKQLTAILKGPNRAFGDLIAASGITDAMLDSLIALRDFEGVEGLPSLSEIEDIRYEKNTKKSTRAEIERQKQEEVANARVRQVDDKGRAYGTGRRKCSVARVWIEPGDGKFVINDKEFDVYFPMLDHRAALLRPFSETKTLGLWDIKCTVQGGGTTGQVGAIQLGISRAMQNWEPDLRAPLRNVGFLTRDPRAVERKKPGKAKARKSFQWVKR